MNDQIQTTTDTAAARFDIIVAQLMQASRNA